MFEFLKRLWLGRVAAAPANPAAEAELQSRVVVRKTPFVTSIDMDSFSPESPEKFYQKLAAGNNLPIFEGEVRHGYSKACAGSTTACPRCGAPTRQSCTHFIYATDRATRAMMAPAGFFCSKCPAVIIDEEILIAGVKPGFKYQGVIGIDFLGKREPSCFETWNGQKPIYIFDEDEQCLGMEFSRAPLWRSGGLPARSAVRMKKQRRRMAKQSRRRNR